MRKELERAKFEKLQEKRRKRKMDIDGTVLCKGLLLFIRDNDNSFFTGESN